MDNVTRFWSKVDKRSDEECWNWKEGISNNGYGKFWVDGRTVGAHRYSLMLAVGPLERDQFACHTCDNPRCVNPNHLFAGSALQNTLDAQRKGRIGVGEKNPGAKLTSETVQKIIAVYAEGGNTVDQIAEMFDISRSPVMRIIQGGAWRSLGVPIERKWVTLTEAIELVKLPANVIIRAFDGGKIEGSYNGRRRIYDRTSLLKWKEARDRVK